MLKFHCVNHGVVACNRKISGIAGDNVEDQLRDYECMRHTRTVLGDDFAHHLYRCVPLVQGDDECYLCQYCYVRGVETELTFWITRRFPRLLSYYHTDGRIEDQRERVPIDSRNVVLKIWTDIAPYNFDEDLYWTCHVNFFNWHFYFRVDKFANPLKIRRNDPKIPCMMFRRSGVVRYGAVLGRVPKAALEHCFLF